MKTTQIDPNDILAAIGTIPQDVPIVMLNLVRYNAQADYGDRMDETPCSGREAYTQRYARAFNQVAAAEGISGIHIIYLGPVVARIVGPPEEHWDETVLVEYPNFAAFRTVVESPIYAADADPHRKAALQDWRLLATIKTPMG